MAAKNLPVVGEAFLGSDPMVSKVIRIAVGVDTTDGVNDVIIADTSQLDILTVSDSKFMITDIKFRITAAFSATNDIHLGVSSSASLILGASTATLTPSLGTVGWADMQIIDTTADSGMIAGAALLSPLANGLIFPQDSSDALTLTAIAAPTNGEMELYVFYVETP